MKWVQEQLAQALLERLAGDLYRFSNKPEQAITHYKRSMKQKVTRSAVFGLYRIYKQQHYLYF